MLISGYYYLKYMINETVLNLEKPVLYIFWYWDWSWKKVIIVFSLRELGKLFYRLDISPQHIGFLQTRYRS